MKRLELISGIIMLFLASVFAAWLVVPAAVEVAVWASVSVLVLALVSALVGGCFWAYWILRGVRVRVVVQESKAAIIAGPGSQVFVPAGGDWLQLSGPAAVPALPEPDEQVHPFLESPLPDLIPLLVREQRMFLLGPSGSGKSSLLRHIVAAKLSANEKVVIVDPHGSRPKWGYQVDSVGFGEDWDGILECFQSLEWVHRQRIQKIAAGHPERQFDIITVVIEELQAIIEYFSQEKVDVGKYIRMFLTRTRKTGIDIITVGQAKTVGATGLKGYSENADAFSFVRVLGKDGRGHKVKYVDEYGEEMLFDPAPHYWPDTKPVGVQPGSIFDLPVAPSEEEAKIIEAVQAGKSDYRVGMDVWGYSTSQTKSKISNCINKFGGNTDV